MSRLVTLIVLASMALLPSAAQAAYPGENGRIAFVDNRDIPRTGNLEIYSMAPDGSDVVQLTNHPNPDENPAWSPDGTKIAFTANRAEGGGIYTMNADGTNQVKVSPGSLPHPAGYPSWSPDGTQIVFHARRATGESIELYAFNSDGTGTLRRLTLNTLTDTDPAWSPDGTKIAFARGMPDDPCSPTCNFEIFSMNPDGTGETRLTFDTDQDTEPDWSPDGGKLAWWSTNGTSQLQVMNADGTGQTGFSPRVDGPWPAWSPDGLKLAFHDRSTGPASIATMNTDGSNRQRLTPGSDPSWQPVQRAYARPNFTGVFYASLVTAFEQCGTPNRTHGPPFGFPSCNPPRPDSPNVVVSAGEVRLRSVGSLRLKSVIGVPGPPDDADVRMRLSITSVLNASDFSDYTGILQPRMVVRLTDREGFQRQTTTDFPFGFQVPCVATSSTADGGLCELATTAEAVIPGSVTEGDRAIWALNQIQVYDGGPAGDGDAESLFAVQGIFSP